MSAYQIEPLADQARALLQRNPLFSKSGFVNAAATGNMLKQRPRYARILAAASELPGCGERVEALARYFPGLADGGYHDADAFLPTTAFLPVRSDPYRSPALAAWMDELQRGLESYVDGASSEVVDHSLQPDLVAEDLALERRPARRLACGIGLVPIDSLEASRTMRRRIAHCRPADPGFEQAQMSDHDLDRIDDHLTKAIELISTVDPGGYQRLTAGLHTLYIGTRRGAISSFSSSGDLPGSAIVVLSQEKLDAEDYPATASELLREAGHVLLRLYTAAAPLSLPVELRYVSPYTHSLQTLESIVHTAYAIPWECAVRIACLPLRAPPEHRAREAAFVIAYAARLIPLIDIAREGIERLGGDVLLDLRDIAVIPSWGAAILALIDRLLECEPLARRKAYYAQRLCVVDRQAWDLGQVLLRGEQPIDPRMGRPMLQSSGDGLSLWYDGRLHMIRKAARQPPDEFCFQDVALAGTSSSTVMEHA
ncbi:HEXXH motif-containing putative peptide modification protein [Neorhizobium sp. T25_13]|uniref:aKG-HExxH-type peptide beta-hydroxylase n=1 Tax=Neorhizobium sp. T25_13 TaxID=2093830 RepID=UPI00155ED637|nr:HEXXH motif-containing putative peptide modification protein [Neorhizobium sp. T25_13]